MDKKLKWQCEKGHTWDAAPVNIKSGYWCPACSSGRKSPHRYSIEDMRLFAEKKGGQCLSDIYININKKLKWQCKKGHVWEARARDIIHGHNWCAECSHKKKGTIEEMQKYAATLHGKCLSHIYINRHTKLRWQCSKGHRWNAKPNEMLNRGDWCPFCSNKRITIKNAQAIAAERGGRCLSKRYFNNRKKMKWQCEKGHIWETPYHNIQGGTWCSHYDCRYKNVRGHCNKTTKTKIMTGGILKLHNEIEKTAFTDYHDGLWYSKFAQLIIFYERHGHCDVPYTKKGYYSLAQWCVRQRYYKKFEYLRLPVERINKLNSIGFCWSISDKMFENKFRQLKSFYNKFGHCNVTPKQNKVLFKWCGKLRQERKTKEKRLTKERIKKLNTIRFEWEVIDSRWMKKYVALKKYVQKNKHFFNFSDIKQHRQLASFVQNLRVKRKAGELKKEKIYLLNKIGFIWNTFDEHWGKRFEELKKYKKRFGHCNVSKGKRDKDYKGLADWVSDQRLNFRKQSPLLTPERIKKLSLLGFSWTPPFKLGEQNRISDTDMLNDLKRLQTLLNRTPSFLDIEKHGKYNVFSYYNHFGNIRKSRQKAGLKSIICRQKK